MIDPGHQAELANEALAKRLVLRSFRVQELERDRNVETRILRPIDRARPASPDERFDPVASEARADSGLRHGGLVPQSTHGLQKAC